MMQPSSWFQPLLKAVFTVLLTVVVWAVAGGCVQAVVVSEELIQKVVTAHVKNQLKTLMTPDDLNHLQVQIVRMPVSAFAFNDVARVEDIEIQAASQLAQTYSDRTVIRLRMMPQNGAVRELGVPVQLSLQKPVWVVKNPVNVNEPLRASDFSLELRDVGRVYPYVSGLERNLSAYIARVNLRPGDWLDTRKIAIPPDVLCNNEVRILMASKTGLTVTVPGVALASGRIGELIRVRQAVFQRKYYMAKVIDKNQVLVQL